MDGRDGADSSVTGADVTRHVCVDSHYVHQPDAGCDNVRYGTHAVACRLQDSVEPT